VADPRAKGAAALRGALLVVVLVSAAPAFAGHGTAIVGATVIDGTGRPALTDGVVVIHGEKVAAVGPRSHVALPKGIPYVDGRLRFVVPGRLAEPAVQAELRRQLAGGASFERALAEALRVAAPPGLRDAIEPGRPADLLVLDKDPRSSLANIGSVSRVFTRGRERPR
jgi:imidazolonepropionase-like amidohydrolase